MCCCCSKNNAENQLAIAQAGGISPLVALVRDGTKQQTQEDTHVLGHLASVLDLVDDLLADPMSSK